MRAEKNFSQNPGIDKTSAYLSAKRALDALPQKKANQLIQAGLSKTDPDQILANLKQAKKYETVAPTEFNNLVDHYRRTKGLPATWKIKLTDAEQQDMIAGKAELKAQNRTRI